MHTHYLQIHKHLKHSEYPCFSCTRKHLLSYHRSLQARGTQGPFKWVFLQLVLRLKYNIIPSFLLLLTLPMVHTKSFFLLHYYYYTHTHTHVYKYINTICWVSVGWPELTSWCWTANQLGGPILGKTIFLLTVFSCLQFLSRGGAPRNFSLPCCHAFWCCPGPGLIYHVMDKVSLSCSET